MIVCELSAFGDLDFCPWYSGLERTQVHDDIDLIGAVVNSSFDLIEFRLGHIVPERKACDRNQKDLICSYFTFCSLDPKWRNANSQQLMFLGFGDQPVDVANL